MHDLNRAEIVEAFGKQVKELVKGLIERMMQEERDLYLKEHQTKGNGHYTRDLLTLVGSLKDLKVPRVREGDFHPRILPYRRRTSVELSEAILGLYAAGVSTRAISRFLDTVYGAFYSPQSISRIAEVVEEEVETWRNRPLDEEYYAIYFDCTFLSIRRGKVAREPVYIALGIKPDGRREILGFWLFGAEGESSHNWQDVARELWSRGVRRVKVFITDDLAGIEEAIRETYPQAAWQLCVLHTVRDTLNKVRKVDREQMAQDLKAIYKAETEEEALQALQALESRWGKTYPNPVKTWREKSVNLLQFLSHPKSIRAYLYTANQLERLMKEVKRRTKVVEVSGDSVAVEKLSYLVLTSVNERLSARRLKEFAEIEVGSYYVTQTH